MHHLKITKNGLSNLFTTLLLPKLSGILYFCIMMLIIIIIIIIIIIAFPHCGYSILQKVTCIHYDNIKLLQYYSILETYTSQEISNDKNETKQWTHYVTI